MFHVYDWDSVFFGLFFFGFFAFAVWFNYRQAKQQAHDWNETNQASSTRFPRRSRRRDNGRERRVRGSADRPRAFAHSRESTRHDSFDFGKMHGDYSSAAGSGYSGPAVNTNGASMIGNTDIYGNSFGANSSSGSGLNRWD